MTTDDTRHPVCGCPEEGHYVDCQYAALRARHAALVAAARDIDPWLDYISDLAAEGEAKVDALRAALDGEPHA